jgi:hypothetical protein
VARTLQRGPTPLSLDGFFLANNYSNLTQGAFPPGSMIGVGEFKLVWADGSRMKRWPGMAHQFPPPARAGSIALASTNNNRSSCGLSQLRCRAAGFVHSAPIPMAVRSGAANLLSDARAHERQHRRARHPLDQPTWMAANDGSVTDPADGASDDWFELFNPGHHRVAWKASRSPTLWPIRASSRFPPGSGSPGGFLLVWADEQSSQTQTNGDLHA